MGSFVFRWPYPATGDVFVTGTFDDWGKSEKLDKVGDVFEKEVQLPAADQKYTYKFVVNDEWVIDQAAPTEDDGHHNVNNVLTPENIKPPKAETAEGATGTAAATDSVPGAFPGTPANESANESEQVSVNPIPATGHDNIQSSVTTSKEDYEKAGTAAGPGAFVVAGGAAAAAAGAGLVAGTAFSKPEGKENLIPESSLPMGAGAGNLDTKDAGPFISSAGPGTTTADLASKVPLEQKRQAMIIDPKDAPGGAVPDAVKESISEGQQSTEAAAPANVVAEKAALEKELTSKVPTSEAAGEPASAAAAQTSYHGLATAVPGAVEKSMAEAKAAPEAASSAAVVAEKSEMEKELLSEVPKSTAAGEPAPTVAAATSAAAPSAAAAGLSTSGVSAPAGEVPSAAAPSEAAAGLSSSGVSAPTGQATSAAATDATSTTNGAVDRTLADEPAVKMMTQNEGPAAAAAGATGAAAAAGTTTAAAATESKAPEVKAPEAKAPETPKKADVVSKETPKKDATVGSAAAAGGTTSSASTPAKKPDSAAASPATTDKKKKNRLSKLWHKIVD